MPDSYEVAATEKVIVTARTLPSLLEGGVCPYAGEQPLRAAFHLEKGMLSAVRLLPPGAGEGEILPGPEWRCLSLPPDQLLAPAFVDCHLHIGLDGVEGFRSFTAPPSPQLLLTRLRALAAAGVLAVRDGGDCYGTAFAAQRLSADANREAGPLPRIVATGPAIYRRGHYGARLGGEGLDGLEGLEQEIRQRKDAGAQQLKVILSGLVSLQQTGKVGPLQFSLPELQKIVHLAAAFELPVMVHASSDAAVRLAVQAGVHSVEHGYFVEEETLRIMAAKGVAWVPTLAPLAALGALGPLGKGPDAAGSEAQAAAGDSAIAGHADPAGSAVEPQNTSVLRRIVEQHLFMLGRARALGVTVCVGTDGGAPGVSWSGGYWLELALLARAGFAPRELLTLAGVNGASLLGLARERGRIAPGKPPYWLCLDMDFLAGRMERRTLKGIIFPSPEPHA